MSLILLSSQTPRAVTPPSAVMTWVVPAAAVALSLAVAAPSAASTWGVPAPTVTQPGVINAPSAIVAWVAPAPSVTGGTPVGGTAGGYVSPFGWWP